MKITKKYLQKVIKEETQRVLNEEFNTSVLAEIDNIAEQLMDIAVMKLGYTGPESAVGQGDSADYAATIHSLAVQIQNATERMVDPELADTDMPRRKVGGTLGRAKNALGAIKTPDFR